MAHTIELRRDLGLIHIHYDGVLTDEALLQGFQADLKAIESQGISAVIVDLTHVSKFTLQSQTNVTLAERGGIPPGVRLVFVAPRDIQFGMARMFELSSDQALSESIRVVRKLAEAYVELNLSMSVAC